MINNYLWIDLLLLDLWIDLLILDLWIDLSWIDWCIKQFDCNNVSIGAGCRWVVRKWWRASAVTRKVAMPIPVSIQPVDRHRLVARVEVIPLFHPKRPSSRTGSGARTTIPWKRPPRARRRKLPVALLPPP